MKKRNYKKKGMLILFTLVFTLMFVSSANIGISPATANFKDVVRNGYAERNIVVSVDLDSEVEVELSARGDVADWLNFSEANFTLTHSEPYILTLSVSPPEDIPNGNYTGFVRFMTSSYAEGMEGYAVGKIRSSLDLAVNVEVTDVEYMDCFASNIEILSAEEGEDLVLKMDVTNNGNVRLNPTIIIDSWDSEQIEVIDSVEFNEGTVLPTTKKSLELRFDSNAFGLGQYWSDVSVVECFQKNTVTFDVLEQGAMTAKGTLLSILTKNEILSGETAPIEVNFKNIGEKEITAQFKGKALLNGNIVQIFETEELIVPVDEIEKFNFYFTPEKAGKYVISGRVFYEGKKTFESSVALDVINVFRITDVVMPLIYFSFVVIIVILLYKIRKEKQVYLQKLRKIK